MDAILTPTQMTPEEYLAWEETQQEKHEYVRGEVFAMTGARLNHNRIALNAAVALRNALREHPCQVFIGDVKVRVEASDVFAYPDVVVSCDERDLADGNALALHHPWLVVEVLSESSAAHDRGRKFEFYRALESLTHYLLVEQTRPHAELFRRGADGRSWLLRPLEADDTIEIDAPHAFRWPVATLFEGVRFEPAPAGAFLRSPY